MKILTVIVMTLPLNGCGNLPFLGQDSKDESPPQITQLSADQVPAQRTNGYQPPAGQLSGTFEQVENAQTRIRISDEGLIQTNLVVPIVTGPDATRVSPEFPQSIRWHADGYYAATGHMNDGVSLFENVEIRLRPYADSALLDVSLIIPDPDHPGLRLCQEPTFALTKKKKCHSLTGGGHNQCPDDDDRDDDNMDNDNGDPVNVIGPDCRNRKALVYRYQKRM